MHYLQQGESTNDLHSNLQSFSGLYRIGTGIQTRKDKSHTGGNVLYKIGKFGYDEIDNLEGKE